MKIYYLHPGYLNERQLQEETEHIGKLLKDSTVTTSAPDFFTQQKGDPFLKLRKAFLHAEQAFRHADASPVTLENSIIQSLTFPPDYEKTVVRQLRQLRSRSNNDTFNRRLPLPRDAQQLWSHHKYSIMARDPNQYKTYGQRFAQPSNGGVFDEAVSELTRQLYQSPDKETLHNALQHMWGHVSDYADESADINQLSHDALLQWIQQLVRVHGAPYLHTSTALTDLQVWI